MDIPATNRAPNQSQGLIDRANAPSEVLWWKHADRARTAPATTSRGSEGAIAFAALVAFTIILLLSPQNFIPILKPLRIALVAAGVAIASLLWDRWKHQQSFLNLTWEMFVCLALPVWAFVTLPLSFWPGGSMQALTQLYIKSIIGFWLLANVMTTPRRLRIVATVLVLCTVPLALTALKNFVTGTFFFDGQTRVTRIVGYEGGLSSNPNDLALVLNLLTPLGVALLLSSRKAWVRIFFLIAIGLNVLGVILTFSRAGFLGLATTGIMYFAKLVRRPGVERSWAFAMLLLAMFSLPFLPSSYLDRLATVTNIQADPTGSAQARWRDNVAAAQFVMEHPIVGAGIGMDALALNQVRGALWGELHNVYLQYAVELGFPGLALFLILLYGVLRAVRSSGRRLVEASGFRGLLLLSEGVEVSLIVFAVEGFFHPVAYHFYFYYIAGLALATRSVTNGAMSVTNASSKTGTQPVVSMASYRPQFIAHELP